MKILDDFCEKAQRQYKSKVSVFFLDGEKMELYRGEPEPAALIRKYSEKEQPRYITSDSKKHLSECGYSSRFSMCIPAGMGKIVFILSSKKKDAFDDTAKYMVNDILKIKKDIGLERSK